MLLEPHLELLKRQARGTLGTSPQEQLETANNLVSLHVALLDELEKLHPDGFAEAHRPLVRLYQDWLRTAREIKTVVFALKAQGLSIDRLDDFMFAINRSKVGAEHFDETVKSNERMARGESPLESPRTLDEILNELHAEVQQNG